MPTFRRATRGDEKSEEIKTKVLKQTRRKTSSTNYVQEREKMWRRWRGKQAEYKNTLNDDEKLTNKPNPPLPMTAQANCCSPLKRGQRWRLPSALELNSWIPVWIQVPWPLQGRDSGLWDRCRLFIFFINLLHMIIYTGLCGRQQSQTLWEEGGVKVDMLSLALYWNRKEDQLNSSRQKKGERGQSWFGTPTLPIKKIRFTLR